jgi:hypothetical protein
VIANLTSGGGFGGVFDYLMNPKEKQREEELERGQSGQQSRQLKPPREAERTHPTEVKTRGEMRAPYDAKLDAQRVGERQEKPLQIKEHKSHSQRARDLAEEYEPGQRHRLIGGNVSGQTPRELEREFNLVRELRPRVEKPVHHASLSAGEKDRLTVAQWQEIADTYIEKMGFQNSPYVVMQHRWSEKDHIHIVASRVDFDGQVVTEWESKQRAEKVMREVEEKYDLERLPMSRDVMRSAPKREEYERALRTGEPSVKMQLQDLVDHALAGQPTATQFLNRLEAAQVEVVPYIRDTGLMTGISFRLDGEMMKGSNLGRGYSWNALQKRGLSYEHERDFAAINRAKEQAAQRGDGRADRTRDDGRGRERTDEQSVPSRGEFRGAGTAGREQSAIGGGERQTGRDRTLPRRPETGRGEVRARDRANRAGNEEPARRDFSAQGRGEEGPARTPQENDRDLKANREPNRAAPDEHRERHRAGRHSDRSVRADGQAGYQPLAAEHDDLHQVNAERRGRSLEIDQAHRGDGATRQPDARRAERSVEKGHERTGRDVLQDAGLAIRQDARDRDHQRDDRGVSGRADDFALHGESDRRHRRDTAQQREVEVPHRQAEQKDSGERGRIQPPDRGGNEAPGEWGRTGREQVSGALERQTSSPSAVENVRQILSIASPTSSSSGEQVELPPTQPSAIEQVQQLLGVETESERLGREAVTFYLGASDLSQQAGIARAEQMVKSVEFGLLEQRSSPDAAQQMMNLKDEIAQAQQSVEAYRDQTGRDPVPILTREQHDFLHTNQDVVRDGEERIALRDDSERAVISGESSRDAVLDYDLPRVPAPVQELEAVRDLSWIIEL